MLNPLAPVLEGLRLALVEGHSLAQPLTGPDGFAAWSPGYLVYAVAVSVLALLGATQMFHRLEFVYAERI
jgi:ABC-type polysaccharide/polyol phosphate export permease